VAKLRILFEDENLVVVDKPAGFYVHPPEGGANGESMRIPKSQNTLALLRDQLGHYVYPVHRLDRATSGVLIFAKNSETARRLSEDFSSRRLEKTYFAFVRGWVMEKLTIDEPLDGKEAITEVHPVKRVLFREAVGRHPEVRATFVQVRLKTGRFHQIRRHLKHQNHPLYGDTVHGDGKHNQWIRTKLPGSGLFLKCYQMGFQHPYREEWCTVTSQWTSDWHPFFDWIGVCGWMPKPGNHPLVSGT
jgi:tRNA pseudouridine65 synthase